ncbi:MAG: hypothetical protein RIQ33_2240, partial [Bacteroidota bacterium]
LILFTPYLCKPISGRDTVSNQLTVSSNQFVVNTIEVWMC